MGVKLERFIVIVGLFLLVFGLSSTGKVAWATEPAMVSPTLGSTLTSSTVIFDWWAGVDSDKYALGVGTSQTSIETRPYGDIYYGGTGTRTLQQVTDIPIDGNKVYVRLWWRIRGNGWTWIDYSYWTQTTTGGGGGGGEAGADFASASSSFVLSNVDRTVETVTITAPSPGVVIVNASGQFWFRSSGRDTGRCSITDGTTVDIAHLIVGEDAGGSLMGYMPFAGTRGFNVSAGTHTFRLVGNRLVGTIYIMRPHMTAIFVPNRY